MELLLNLLWLMLALPAFWLWKREKNQLRRRRMSGGKNSIILLGCVLVLLFPVVSVTDDIHAVRSEMEERSPSKRMVRQSADDGPHAPAVDVFFLVASSMFAPHPALHGERIALAVFRPEQEQVRRWASRGPPYC